MIELSPIIALAIISVGILFVITRWQKTHPEFDLADLLTGDNGKVSLSKCGQASALMVSTWGFVVLVQQGKLTEWYFMAYMAVWAGYRLAQTAIESKAPTQ